MCQLSPLYNNNLFNLKFETGSCFLKSMKKILYTLVNKISQHSESSLETWVPYHSNCNAMVCRCYSEEYMVLEAEPLNSLIYIVFVCLFARFVFFFVRK